MIRKRQIVAVLWLLAFCGSVWAMEGNGTEADPYVITNVEELQAMQDDLGAYYVLGNDIDACDTRNWNGGAGFEPIGSDVNSFTGTFDGQGHVIIELYINRPNTDGVGLFGYVRDNAVIKKVGLADVDVTARRNSGPLVGSSSGATICDSWSTGTIQGSYDYQMRLGGLIGISSGANSFVSRCFADTMVIASGGAHQVGGLAGYNGHGSVMSDCYATGDITGSWKVGGLVGDNTAGSEGTLIKRCYSAGKVTGGGGGLVGYNWQSGITQDSYWDIQTSGKSSSYGGTGKTTAEMMQQATFVNWDFDDVWGIVEGETYPFLLCAVEVNDLVAHWKFDEGSGDIAYDSAGDNDGTLVNGPTWTTGQVVGALSFDGVDDYVFVGTGPATSGTNIFTWGAWIKTTATSSGYILSQRGASSADGFITLRMNADGTISFFVYLTALGFYINPATTVNDGNWHHVVCSRINSTDGILYIDGTGTSGTGSKKSLNINPVCIGKQSASTPVYFNGIIDDVRIYDRALSAEEVERLYWEGFSRSEFAIRAIEDALDKKLEALERVDAALESESLAYQALEELLESGDYGDLNKGDIVKAKQKIHSAIQHEEQSINALEKSIGKLEDSLSALGYEAEPNEGNNEQ